MSTSSEYVALRRSAGFYDRARLIVAVSGAGTGALLSHALARSTEFLQPGSVADSLVLDDEGRVIDIVLAIVDESRTLLLSSAESDLVAELTAVAASLTLADVRIQALTGWSALAVEGPLSWRAVQHFIDDDIAGLVLNEWRPVTRDALPGGLLARTGTTAEYGYVVVTPTDPEAVIALLDPADLSVVGAEALLRARMEVNHPVLEQFTGMSVVDAGAGWAAGIEREDTFRGGDRLGGTGQRLVAIRFEGELTDGTDLAADGEHIGHVHLVAPSTGDEEGFALATLRSPFDVPGLELDANGVAVRTVSRPAVRPLSWVEPIG